jgi:hypothetical protein
MAKILVGILEISHRMYSIYHVKNVEQTGFFTVND